ncbi:MAG: ABC transporter permease, partial [Spirochaetales bacterium]|nr:ABC transporter permease [Spirochaetales bacterium]
EATGPVVWLAVLGAVAVGLAVSAALGAVNGFLIGYVEVPAVLATLGTMILYEGVTLSITRGFVVSGLPAQFLVLGNLRVVGVPIQMWIFAIVTALVALLLRRRPYGVHLYFVGSNRTASAFSGVNVPSVLMRTYILSGVLAGIAAIVMLARFNSANARQGSSLLLSTVLICMLGGTDPFGGFGKVSGLVMALAVLQMVTSGLNLLGVRSFATVALWGVMLSGVMVYRFVRRRRSERREKDGTYPR